jgi:hypothetical protein
VHGCIETEPVETILVEEKSLPIQRFLLHRRLGIVDVSANQKFIQHYVVIHIGLAGLDNLEGVNTRFGRGGVTRLLVNVATAVSDSLMMFWRTSSSVAPETPFARA